MPPFLIFPYDTPFGLKESPIPEGAGPPMGYRPFASCWRCRQSYLLKWVFQEAGDGHAFTGQMSNTGLLAKLSAIYFLAYINVFALTSSGCLWVLSGFFLISCRLLPPSSRVFLFHKCQCLHFCWVRASGKASQTSREA